MAEKTLTRPVANAQRVRLAALSLGVCGVLFVLYPALRPFSDEVSLQGKAAFAAPGWIVAHVLAMIGFILLILGLVGLHLSLRDTPGEHLAFQALIVSWIGTGLLLPFYGAEAFGLHAIGQAALSQQNAALLALANDVRTGPGLIVFLVGLVLLAAGTIMAAVAIWRSGKYSKWSGVPFALGFALFIPQFFGTQPLRILHGLLIAAGCLWIAMNLWTYAPAALERDKLAVEHA